MDVYTKIGAFGCLKHGKGYPLGSLADSAPRKHPVYVGFVERPGTCAQIDAKNIDSRNNQHPLNQFEIRVFFLFYTVKKIRQT